MRPTILVIETYEVLRQALGEWLPAMFPDYQVIQAGHDTEALALAQAHRPEVAIVSLGSFEKNNLLIVQQLRRYRPLMKIVILTWYDDDTYRTQAVAAGANAIVPSQNMTLELQQTLQILMGEPATERQTSL